MAAAVLLALVSCTKEEEEPTTERPQNAVAYLIYDGVCVVYYEGATILRGHNGGTKEIQLTGACDGGTASIKFVDNAAPLHTNGGGEDSVWFDYRHNGATPYMINFKGTACVPYNASNWGDRGFYVYAESGKYAILVGTPYYAQK